ncbi:MAG: hypothetical protein U0T77_10655 [Chitinophagales bacterium]
MKITVTIITIATVLFTACSSVPNYEIVNVKFDKFDKQGTYTVKINTKLPEDSIKMIAEEIKSSCSECNEVFIYFFPPNYDVNSIAWATVEYDPSYVFKQIGTTVSSNSYFPPKGQIIGKWEDNYSVGLEHTVYIFKDADTLKMRKVYSDGSFGDDIIEESEYNGLRKFTRNLSEWYVLERNGNLSLYGDNGKYAECVKKDI